MTRLYDAPFGQIQEFLKRLANAGFTQEEMVRLTNNPGAMKEWVESLGTFSTSQLNPNMPVSALFNDVRTATTLNRNGVLTVDDLLDWTEDELSFVRNCGQRMIEIITSVLAENGLSLSTRTDYDSKHDPGRIYSLSKQFGFSRSWRRDKIGRLPLDMFVRFDLNGNLNLNEASFWPHKVVHEQIDVLAAMSDEKLLETYDERLGQRIISWIDENYRPWIG